MRILEYAFVEVWPGKSGTCPREAGILSSCLLVPQQQAELLQRRELAVCASC
jgi:hypothetical protein